MGDNTHNQSHRRDVGFRDIFVADLHCLVRQMVESLLRVQYAGSTHRHLQSEAVLPKWRVRPQSFSHSFHTLGFELLTRSLRRNSIGETVATDHLQFVNSASDSFVLVVGLKLKGDQPPVGVDHAGGTSDSMTQRRWGEVLDIDMCTHSAFVLVEYRQHRLSCGVLKKPNQPRRA